MTAHSNFGAVVTECPTCGCTPCGSPGFFRLCRDADRKAAAERRRREAPDLPLNWDQMSVDALWEALNDPRRRSTPQSTTEAIMVAVRIRGLAALKEPATLERLGRCDPQAREEINQRIGALREKGVL